MNKGIVYGNHWGFDSAQPPVVVEVPRPGLDGVEVYDGGIPKLNGRRGTGILPAETGLGNGVYFYR